MKQTELQQFKRKLLALRDELRRLEQTGADAAQTVELDQTRVGRLSRMDALQAQAMSLETQRRRRLRLSRIGRALAAIDAGDYGRCEECDEPIADARLQFDPSAITCIGCAQRLENGS